MFYQIDFYTTFYTFQTIEIIETLYILNSNNFFEYVAYFKLFLPYFYIETYILYYCVCVYVSI